MKIVSTPTKAFQVCYGLFLLLLLIFLSCKSTQKLSTANKKLSSENMELISKNMELKDKNKALVVELNQYREQKEIIKKQENKIIEINANRLRLLESGKERDMRLMHYEKIFQSLKEQIISDKFKVRLQGRRLILALPSDVIFDSGKANITEEGLKTVEEIAQLLRGIKNRRFQVEGHTDNIPIHSKRYKSNWELAASRAFTVLQILHEGGVAKNLLSFASFSSYQPIASNDTEDGRRLNRRVDISLIPDLSVLPNDLLSNYVQMFGEQEKQAEIK